MTTLSKEDAIRAALDGKTVEQRGPENKGWSPHWSALASSEKLQAISMITSYTDGWQFRIKPEPVVSYISKHRLEGLSDSTILRERFPLDEILRVEAYPDGTYKVTRVEE